MTQHNISTIAHLIAEPVRAVMLITLADGEARSASALAEAAGVSAQTASSHLSKLLHGGLLTVDSQGRHRFFRLAGSHIPHLLESLACAGPVTPAWRDTPNPSARELRFARCCYDHLAGQVGVAVTRGMLQRGFIIESGEREYAMTSAGTQWTQQLGLDVGPPVGVQTGLARRCLDWTEREHHMAGPMGAHLMNAFCTWGWIQRRPLSRSVIVTDRGWQALGLHFGIEQDQLNESSARRRDLSRSVEQFGYA